MVRPDFAGKPAAGYIFAITAVLMAALSRLVLAPLFPDGPPLIIFLLASIVAVWMGGRGPGYAALGFSVFLGIFDWYSPAGPMLPTAATFTRGLILGGTGVIILILFEKLREANEQLARSLETQQAAERERQKSQARYAACFRLTAIGMAQVDPSDGRFLEVNNRLCEITQHSKEELLACTVFDLTLPEDRSNHEELYRKVEGGLAQAMRADVRLVSKSGSVVWAHVNLSAPEANPNYTIAAIQDISPRKRFESELKSAVEEKEYLLRSYSELQDLLYAMSHDLQEPLRSISNYGQLMKRRYYDKLDEPGREFLEFIIEGTKQLHARNNALVEYAEIVNRTPSLRAVSADEAAARAVEELQGMIVASGAAVSRDPLPTVIADPHQLLLIFKSLIENALVYRGERAPRVHISARPDTTHHVLSVSDNGAGIEPDQYERIFVIFRRAQRERLGRGIGLAACKKILERHNGKIWVESEKGKGSTFYFSMPAA